MDPFTAAEQDIISNAITRAEAKTSGEIVVVVTSAADGYRSFAILWAALLALAVPLPFVWATQWPIEYVYILQLLVFLVCLVLFQWETIRFALVPKGIKHARAHQKAVDQFLAQSLHTTKGRTGVLIFVAFAEHFAEVIADDGIYRKVSPSMWQDVIGELTNHLGEGSRTEGLVRAVERCGKILARHFPPNTADANELPNHLIVLDGP